jgi:DNA-binding response OmpR family regulator
MLRQSVPRANFILHELEESLAAQLCQAASEPGHAFHCAGSTAECLLLAERLHADVVFCSSEPREYQALLDAVKLKGMRLPVVVVSRLPEVSEWLDALDAGATDYCAAPFEHRHMSWLIQSALLASQHAASFA